MNKLIKVVATAVSVAPLSYASFADGEIPAAAEPEAVEVEEEASPVEFGFDFDFLSAYVWRNAVQTDRMVMQPCVWADLTYFEPFWLGFSVWQNYDLSHRRGAIYRYGLNETDYNVHLGATVWDNEDEDNPMSVDLEIGHDWYTYHGVRDEAREDYPDTSEIYVKATFNNEIVSLYGQASWMYRDFGCYEQAMHYELGLTKEVEVCDDVTAGADLNVNFGDSNYLYYLFGGVSSPYYVAGDDEEEGGVYDDYDGAPKGGIAGATIKFFVNWAITDYLSLGATVGYTGLLNAPLRESMGDVGDDFDFNGTGDSYPRDLAWGGISLHLAF